MKTYLEALFVMSLQEEYFLHLCIVESPYGISIDHIIDTLIGLDPKSHYVSKLNPITSPFPTDSNVEWDNYWVQATLCGTRTWWLVFPLG
jgi:hypothetical protein